MWSKPSNCHSLALGFQALSSGCKVRPVASSSRVSFASSPSTSSTCPASSFSRSYSASSAARPTELPVRSSSSTSSSSLSSTSSSASPATSRASKDSQRTTPTRTYGQPLPHSHPHLFPRRGPLGSESLSSSLLLHPGSSDPQHFLLEGNPSDGSVAMDELTPGIPKSEYEQRRRKLMERLPESSVVVVLSGRMKSMSANIFYKFRQDSNFFYLTGFLEPDSALILEKKGSDPRGYRMTMFVQPRDDHNETWNGPRTGLDGCTDIFGSDLAFEMDPTVLASHLKSLVPSYNHVYVDPPVQPSVPRRLVKNGGGGSGGSGGGNILNYLSPPSTTGLDLFSRKTDFEVVVKMLGDTRKCHSLAKELDKLRFKKSDNELRVMKRAGEVSSLAMRETMGFVRPGCNESQLQSVFEYHCSMNGSQRPAYVPVVASGSNALTIHYINNDRIVQPGDLVCIDAGCELDGYASDITRAFPSDPSGRFSKPQADLYQAVLNVLKGCTKLATESQGYSLSELHRRSVEMLSVELRQLGFQLGTSTLERILYPHYIGHWLGIDLHDTPTVDRSTKLEKGVVVTVEPGVYVPIDDAFPKHFQGIGIRIEDDVAVGLDDNLILSSSSPREIVDVEATCSRFFDLREQNLESGQQPTRQRCST